MVSVYDIQHPAEYTLFSYLDHPLKVYYEVEESFASKCDKQQSKHEFMKTKRKFEIPTTDKLPIFISICLLNKKKTVAKYLQKHNFKYNF